MRALSVRQPFAELILRGIKTVEYRSRATRIIGQRFHIYAAKKELSVAGGRWPVWSRDLASVDEHLPQWMIELAEQIKLIPPGTELPRGVIVGSAVIEKCVPSPTINDQGHLPLFEWHLAGVARAAKLRKPNGHPQPVWFKPF